jgi:hypothetical protein
MLPIESESVQRAIFRPAGTIWRASPGTAVVRRHAGLSPPRIAIAAVFRPGADQALAEFTTARAQILNQEPGLINC